MKERSNAKKNSVIEKHNEYCSDIELCPTFNGHDLLMGKPIMRVMGSGGSKLLLCTVIIDIISLHECRRWFLQFAYSF